LSEREACSKRCERRVAVESLGSRRETLGPKPWREESRLGALRPKVDGRDIFREPDGMEIRRVDYGERGVSKRA